MQDVCLYDKSHTPCAIYIHIYDIPTQYILCTICPIYKISPTHYILYVIYPTEYPVRTHLPCSESFDKEPHTQSWKVHWSSESCFSLVNRKMKSTLVSLLLEPHVMLQKALHTEASSDVVNSTTNRYFRTKGTLKKKKDTHFFLAK